MLKYRVRENFSNSLNSSNSSYTYKVQTTNKSGIPTSQKEESGLGGARWKSMLSNILQNGLSSKGICPKSSHLQMEKSDFKIGPKFQISTHIQNKPELKRTKF